MGNRLNRCYEKDIISEKSLGAVHILINYLKQHVRNRNLFHSAEDEGRVQQIVTELDRGNNGLQRILDQGSPGDCAAALQYFLIRLKKPLIPHRIQALALDENPGVRAETIAQDILGLLREEVTGRHEVLITCILDLLNSILKNSPTDELRGCNVPITMLPIFFNLETQHVPQWRRVATIFVELIRLAPTTYDIQSEASSDEIIDNFEEANHNYLPNNMDLQQHLLELNMVLRRHLIRAGYSGDCQEAEALAVEPVAA